ncbi:MAG: FtsX-like permease family protein, partial [Alphaproteobacteria bacterium]
PLVSHGANFELRTAGDPHGLAAAVRQIVAHTDSDLPIFDMRTQSEQIDEMIYRERLMSRLSSFFGLLALCLACIGLYGLLSYEVAQRTRELGIRMALGAKRSDLTGLVLRRGFFLVLAGVAAGGIAAFGITRFMMHLLYNVRPDDPATFIAVTALLILIALAASLIPARRATRVDPMVALRCE